MIITDEALLRVKCIDVLPEEVEHLKKKLEEELNLSAELGRPGIGLACPQIGVAKNMAIVRIPGVMSVDIDLVNCKIAEGHDKADFDGEGCLSFPGLTMTTSRYKEIKVIGNLVEPQEFIATGLLAVCIQHELDHLNGVLLPDLAINK